LVVVKESPGLVSVFALAFREGVGELTVEAVQRSELQTRIESFDSAFAVVDEVRRFAVFSSNNPIVEPLVEGFTFN
jgi:hypothetical protein